MSLRFTFTLLLLFQIPVYILAGILSAKAFSPWFYAVEILAVANIALCIYFFRKVIRPIYMIKGGMDLLNSQDWNSRLVKVGNSDVDAAVDVFNQMFTRLHNQKVEMEEQRHFLSALTEVTPVGIVICGPRGEIILENPAAKKLMPDHSLLEEGTIRTADGTLCKIIKGTFIEKGVNHSFYVIENITDAVAAAERVAYGKVIRIIAHEINNSVAGLNTALSALELEHDPELIAACATRTKSLGQFIDKYAEVVRTPQANLRQVDLCSLANSLKPFLESLCKPREIDFSIVCPESDVNVMADAPMLEQVIVNAVKNSCESICAKGNICLEIEAQPPAIVVADNGPGISVDARKKIFSPFFTDKPGGQGIGLTFAREIACRHNANCTLSTTDLTRFRFEFRR